MHPPSRARRILKWTGIRLSVLILATWIASLRYQATALPRQDLAIFIGQGLIAVGLEKDIEDQCGLYIGVEDQTEELCCDMVFRRLELGADSVIWGGWVVMGGTWIGLPFWLLLLVTAIPTAWLWHRDRRLISSSPDHRLCLRCGYDLTGNTSGVCPECGDKACPPAVLADSECKEATKIRVTGSQ